MRSIFGELGDAQSSDDLSAGAARLSLLCPLSMARIVTPVRSQRCTHLEAFDLNNYLTCARVARFPKFLCPRCSAHARPYELRIDPWMERLLEVRRRAPCLLPSPPSFPFCPFSPTLPLSFSRLRPPVVYVPRASSWRNLCSLTTTAAGVRVSLQSTPATCLEVDVVVDGTFTERTSSADGKATPRRKRSASPAAEISGQR